MEYISTIISGCSMLIVFATFIISRSKDHDANRENNIKMNVKLDQLCTNTNNILLKQEKQEDRMQELEKKIVITERDIKTAFKMIDELKGQVSKDD